MMPAYITLPILLGFLCSVQLTYQPKLATMGHGFWNLKLPEDKEDEMKSRFTSLLFSLMLVLCLASPAALATQPMTKKDKSESAHAAAVKKCKADYNEAMKKAKDDYQAAVKEAKPKKGKEHHEAVKAAATARDEAQAAAKKAKKECIAAAPTK